MPFIARTRGGAFPVGDPTHELDVSAVTPERRLHEGSDTLVQPDISLALSRPEEAADRREAAIATWRDAAGAVSAAR